MLLSHKLLRWLVPWSALAGALGFALLAVAVPALRLPVGLVLGCAVLSAGIAWTFPDARLPRVVALPAYVVWGLAAGVHAWVTALRGDLTPTWEPTRRSAAGTVQH